MYNLMALLIALILITVFIVFNRDKFVFLSIFKSSKKRVNEILSKDIERKILVDLSKYERVLYKEGFTNRVNIEIKKGNTDSSGSYYKFYYYNLIEGIHAFIKYNPSGKYRKIYYYFETKFNSEKRAVTSNFEMYVSSKIPKNIYYFKYPINTTIQELYNIHKNERLIGSETVYKHRYSIDYLIKSELEEKDDKRWLPSIKRGDRKKFNLNIKKRGKINLKSRKKIDLGSVKLNLKNLFIFKKVKKYKIDKKYYLSAVLGVLLVSGLFFGVNSVKKEKNNINVKNSKILTVLDSKKEIINFKKTINQYSKLSSNINEEDKKIEKFIDKLAKFYEFIGIKFESKKSDADIKSYLKEIDKYLKKYKIKVSSGYKGSIKESKKCKLPKNLKEILKWHNGVEEFMPNTKLLSLNELQKGIKSKKEYIFFLKDKNAKGLTFNCSKNGLYIKNENGWKKEFYSIKHLLKVVAKSYKDKAFYMTKNGPKIDLDKYYKIYRESLSKKDMEKYNKLIDYLKKRAKLYKERGDKELRIMLIKEIKKLHDSRLKEILEGFKNDKYFEVRKLIIGK